jgi:hypothetical protein
MKILKALLNSIWIKKDPDGFKGGKPPKTLILVGGF